MRDATTLKQHPSSHGPQLRRCRRMVSGSGLQTVFLRQDGWHNVLRCDCLQELRGMALAWHLLDLIGCSTPICSSHLVTAICITPGHPGACFAGGSGLAMVMRISHEGGLNDLLRCHSSSSIQ